MEKKNQEHRIESDAGRGRYGETAPVPRRRFRMGSREFYPEERPVVHAEAGPFRMDLYPVTNRQFLHFVEQTGYVTTAERTPDPLDYPGIDPGLLVPGSLVFFPADRALRNPSVHNWWRYVPGACWNRPEGPGSSVDDRLDHPVVHVTLEDALSYARWAGKDLPTETVWELAARGGLEGAVFVWGDEERPGGRIMANTWQGEFPWQNLLTDGFFRTSPVGSFPPNGYGLYDMAGNVWEWTSDPYRPYHASPDARPGKVQKAVKLFGANGIAKRSGSCCRPPDTPRAIPQYVVKGGSHLCAPNYCMRYRPAARQGQEIDSSTSHIGFR